VPFGIVSSTRLAGRQETTSLKVPERRFARGLTEIKRSTGASSVLVNSSYLGQNGAIPRPKTRIYDP